MPFDGVVAKSVVEELREMLSGSRIEKIFQPESDEIIINIRAKGQNLRLLLSANANYPRIHITQSFKENPASPYVFCMLLRKHLSGGRVMGVEFFDFERIISLQVEAVNELGDLSVKKLIIEIMGRHSNIILVNEGNKILDSIKHIDNEISSVREVMPARDYVFPPSQNKLSPQSLNVDEFIDAAALQCSTSPNSIATEKYLLETIKGFSPLMCREICFRSGIDGKASLGSLHKDSWVSLNKTLKEVISTINMNSFKPCILLNAEASPLDFHCLDIMHHNDKKYHSSMSFVLDEYYASRDRAERLKQKKADTLKVITTGIDRCNKKLAIQQDKLREVSDRENLKLCGELITANIYCIPHGAKTVSLLNYYSENNQHMDVTLDDTLSPQENAQRYFKRYLRAKNTYGHTTKQLEESRKELDYLEGMLHLLDSCINLQEIGELRQELIEQGYIHSKLKKTSKKGDKPLPPMHYQSSQGLDIYVGKNNRQNDALTLKAASSNDIWLHTRNIPGSHVIIKKPQQNIPNETLLEAAMIAAYHSKAKLSSNVAVDYTTVKNVKKPNGAKPGMVIYENFKTIIVSPDEGKVKKLLKG